MYSPLGRTKKPKTSATRLSDTILSLYFISTSLTNFNLDERRFALRAVVTQVGATMVSRLKSTCMASRSNRANMVLAAGSHFG